MIGRTVLKLHWLLRMCCAELQNIRSSAATSPTAVYSVKPAQQAHCEYISEDDGVLTSLKFDSYILRPYQQQ